ncbi:hypothetical protein NDU88_001019 [Pleurodeles waltl]|uniref:Uncharacterized protein n=1 Tax=Pleurodeles waltl TaxID=8319 RepID=A0AAV7U848_PLEWA|nr:hypothetical protein NDU88_001019 [Pleurodeles waltl]
MGMEGVLADIRKSLAALSPTAQPGASPTPPPGCGPHDPLQWLRAGYRLPRVAARSQDGRWIALVAENNKTWAATSRPTERGVEEVCGQAGARPNTQEACCDLVCEACPASLPRRISRPCPGAREDLLRPERSTRGKRKD